MSYTNSANNDHLETSINITEESFQMDVLGSVQAVVVDFWAEWCAPCVAFSPLIESLATNYSDRALVVKVNVDHNRSLAERYSIRSIPTVLIFKAGEVVERISGTVPTRILTDKLQKHIS